MNSSPLGSTSKKRQNRRGERSPVKPIVRRALVGLLCGMASSIFLCSAVRSVGLGLFLGSLLGIAQVFAFFELEGGSAIDRAMTCAAVGLPFWATINLILLPLAAGQEPQWTAEDMRSLFPALIGWSLFFLFLGAISQAARRVSEHFLGPESDKTVSCYFRLTNTSRYGATALLSRQTANKDYQSSHIILGEFLSECRHFAFNPV
jgi:hypothetical protein